jgi:hypothetical protein
MSSTDDLLRIVIELFTCIWTIIKGLVNTISPADIIAAVVRFVNKIVAFVRFVTKIASVIVDIDITGLLEYVRVHFTKLAVFIHKLKTTIKAVLNTISPADIVAAVVRFVNKIVAFVRFVTKIASVIVNIDITGALKYVRVHFTKLAVFIHELIGVYSPPAIIAFSHEHPYILGIGLLFVFEPTLILNLIVITLNLLLPVIMIVVILLLRCIGFGPQGPRGGTYSILCI